MRTVDPKLFSTVIGTLTKTDARSAVKIVDTHTVIRATWRFKPTVRARQCEMVVTFGAPNYLDRRFIKLHGVPGEVLIKVWPKKKAKK